LNLPASNRAKLAVVFAAAIVIAMLRVGLLSHVGSLRLGAPAAMSDFLSSVYYPVRAFLEGENAHDAVRLNQPYPKVEAYPPHLPPNLVVYLPFGLVSPSTPVLEGWRPPDAFWLAPPGPPTIAIGLGLVVRDLTLSTSDAELRGLCVSPRPPDPSICTRNPCHS